MSDNRDRGRRSVEFRRDRRIPAAFLEPRARYVAKYGQAPKVEVHKINGQRFVAVRTSRNLLTLLTEETALELTNRIVDAIETV